MDAVPDAAYGAGVDLRRTTFDPRCWRCGRRLAEYLTEPFSIRCQRCKAANRAGVTLSSSTT